MMKLYKLKEVSEKLSIPESTLRNWSKGKSFPAFKIGQSWRVDEQDLNNWLTDKKKEESSAPLSTSKNSVNIHLASEKGVPDSEYYT
jgi:excisionase family DNA binding protein